MFRKVLLVGGVLFVVLPGIWLWVEHAAGRRQLASVLAAQEAAGEVFDIAKLAGPIDRSLTNVLQAQVAAAQAMGDAGRLLPSAQRMVAPGRAVEPTRFEGWTSGQGGSTNTWGDVTAWVERHGEHLDALHAALAGPQRRAELDYSVGFAHLQLPHLSPIKNTATSLALAATEASRRGDLDGALADLGGIRVVQADLAPEPILITHLVRIACASIANRQLWAVLHAGEWNDAQLARIQSALPAKDLVSGVVRSLEGERAVCLADIRRSSASELAKMWADSNEVLASVMGGGPAPMEIPGSVDEAVEFAGTLVSRLAELLRLRVLFPIWHLGWGDQAVAHYLESMRMLLQASRAGMAAGSLQVAESADLLERLRPEGLRGRLRAVYTSSLMPALAKATAKGFRAETEIALNEAGIALRRYRLRHGRYPESLEELVPDLLPSVPMDRMDGKPIRYRREGEKGFVLWSVGEDFKDDGGDPSWEGERSSMMQWWTARDAVWPRAASAEEVASWEAREKAKARAKPSGFPAMSEELLRRYGLLPKAPSNAPAGDRNPAGTPAAPPATAN